MAEGGTLATHQSSVGGKTIDSCQQSSVAHLIHIVLMHAMIPHVSHSDTPNDVLTIYNLRNPL